MEGELRSVYPWLKKVNYKIGEVRKGDDGLLVGRVYIGDEAIARSDNVADGGLQLFRNTVTCPDCYQLMMFPNSLFVTGHDPRTCWTAPCTCWDAEQIDAGGELKYQTVINTVKLMTITEITRRVIIDTEVGSVSRLGAEKAGWVQLYEEIRSTREELHVYQETKMQREGILCHLEGNSE